MYQWYSLLGIHSTKNSVVEVLTSTNKVQDIFHCEVLPDARCLYVYDTDQCIDLSERNPQTNLTPLILASTNRWMLQQVPYIQELVMALLYLHFGIMCDSVLVEKQLLNTDDNLMFDSGTNIITYKPMIRSVSSGTLHPLMLTDYEKKVIIEKLPSLDQYANYLPLLKPSSDIRINASKLRWYAIYQVKQLEGLFREKIVDIGGIPCYPLDELTDPSLHARFGSGYCDPVTNMPDFWASQLEYGILSAVEEHIVSIPREIYQEVLELASIYKWKVIELQGRYFCKGCDDIIKSVYLTRKGLLPITRVNVNKDVSGTDFVWLTYSVWRSVAEASKDIDLPEALLTLEKQIKVRRNGVITVPLLPIRDYEENLTKRINEIFSIQTRSVKDFHSYPEAASSLHLFDGKALVFPVGSRWYVAGERYSTERRDDNPIISYYRDLTGDNNLNKPLALLMEGVCLGSRCWWPDEIADVNMRPLLRDTSLPLMWSGLYEIPGYVRGIHQISNINVSGTLSISESGKVTILYGSRTITLGKCPSAVPGPNRPIMQTVLTELWRSGRLLKPWNRMYFRTTGQLSERDNFVNKLAICYT